MKRTLLLSVVFALLQGMTIYVTGVFADTKESVNWLGVIVVQKTDARPGYNVAPTDYELGLRADGVAVWRKKG